MVGYNRFIVRWSLTSVGSTHPFNESSLVVNQQVCLVVEVDWAHLAMVRWRVMFCEVITLVVFSWLPVDLELSLSDSVTHPVKSHVNGF